MQTFTGFSDDTVRFIGELTMHNEKAWFEENRPRYETGWLEPAKVFVEALGAKLRKLSPGLQFEPKINGSLMRINRDTRFSKNKDPYKSHLDLWFWQGPDKGWQQPGFYFSLTPKALTLGAGVYFFEPELLVKYRKAVAAQKTGAQLVKIIGALSKKGIEVGGEHYKRVPKGFPPDHPRGQLLKYSGLYAGFKGKPPKELKSVKFVDYCVERYRAALPLHQWLGKLK